MTGGGEGGGAGGEVEEEEGILEFEFTPIKVVVVVGQAGHRQKGGTEMARAG